MAIFPIKSRLKKKKDKEKVGFVYLLADFDREGIYKIGVTTGTIENRIKKLQTGNSGEIYIADYFKSKAPFFVERWMHKHYISKRVLNEWFELSLEERKNFKEICQKYEALHDNIEEMNNNPDMFD
jgi:hypothetical protein